MNLGCRPAPRLTSVRHRGANHPPAEPGKASCSLGWVAGKWGGSLVNCMASHRQEMIVSLFPSVRLLLCVAQGVGPEMIKMNHYRRQHMPMLRTGITDTHRPRVQL